MKVKETVGTVATVLSMSTAPAWRRWGRWRTCTGCSEDCIRRRPHVRFSTVVRLVGWEMSGVVSLDDSRLDYDTSWAGPACGGGAASVATGWTDRGDEAVQMWVVLCRYPMVVTSGKRDAVGRRGY